MNKNFLALIFVFLIFTISLTQNALAGSATISWNANTESDLSGYKIYYGTSPRSGACPTGNYPNVIDVGNVTTYTFNNLTDGSTYYFSVTAYDTSNNESTCSAEVNKAVAAITLTASLTATPSSGASPLNGVDLTAIVGGNATGNINYTFYCNRSDSGINITTPYDAKYDNQSVTSKTATDICNYTNSGTYTAKVITERGGAQAEARTTITVSQSQSTKFQIGNTVYVSSGPLSIRATASASGILLGSQTTNAQGSVIGGPTYSDGYWWWQIDYNIAPDGWSVENYLEKYTPAAITNVNFIPHSESIINLGIAGKQFVITIFQAGSQIAQFTGAANAQNQIPLPTNITNVMPGNYDIYSDTGQHLKGKTANISLSSGATITLPTLKSGDLDDNGIINSLDWSSMNGNWFTTNIVADLNRDGIVNSLDFSWMNKNWGQTDAI